MASKRFKSETFQDTKSIGEYLSALQQGLENGEFSMTQAGQELQFHPQGLIAFAVEGKISGSERKIKLVVRWNEGDGGDRDEDAPLLIQS